MRWNPYILFLFWIPLTSSASLSCQRRCALLGDDEEQCLVVCSRLARSADHTYYPAPPQNVTIETEVVIDNGKFLETTVYWDYIPDEERTGFYLRYKAVQPHCQKMFPGYFISDIKPSARSHPIPLEQSGQALVVEHGCAFRLEMHSKPYPYGDALYTVVREHVVPDCIKNYCKCEPNAIALPSTIHAQQGDSGVEVEWTYAQMPRPLTFYLTLHERFHPPVQFGDPHAFPFRIVDESDHVVQGSENQTFFHTVIPFPLRMDEEYKVTLFAEDAQYCHTSDVAALFNTSSIVTLPPPPTTPLLLLPTQPVRTTTQDVTQDHPEGLSVSAVSTTDSPASPGLLVVSHRHALLALIALAIALPLLACVCCWVRRARNRPKMRKERFGPWTVTHSRHSMLETNILYRRPIEFRTPKSDEEWVIKRDDLNIGQPIGEGAFGLVCKGSVRGPRGMAVRVAVKQLKANAADEEREEFHREVDIMKQVGRHPHIVTMYGHCLDQPQQCMVMEYVPFGDLKHYLQNLRKQLSLAVSTLKSSLQFNDMPMQGSFMAGCDDPPLEMQYHLDPAELHDFAAQIANGMAHLESLGITHRDLAARNVLVGENKQLKISDFGMSRPGIYVKMSRGVIPLRWLSIEAIKDHRYSTKSDVWAFGVVVWEICTLGGFPYPTVADQDLLNHLIEGHRLEKPASCSDQIYSLMMECWCSSAPARPSFAYLADQLGQIEAPYVAFERGAALPPHDLQTTTVM